MAAIVPCLPPAGHFDYPEPLVTATAPGRPATPDRAAPVRREGSFYAGAVHLGLVAIVVGDYDAAISFFVDSLGFELAEDSPAEARRQTSIRIKIRITITILTRSDTRVCCNRDMFTKASSPPPSPPEEEREKFFGRIVKLLLLHNTRERHA